MTLDDLRKHLAELDHLPGDTLVVLQKDAEGNGYSPLAGASIRMYLAETTWSGETYPTEAEIVDPESGYDDEDGAPEGAVPAVVLWPVN